MENRNIYMSTAVKIACTLTGIWPNNFKNWLVRFLYNIHSKLCLFYFIFFVFSQMVIMVNDGAKENLRSASYIISGINNIIFIAIIKGKRIQHLFKHILEMQDKIFTSKDKSVIDIFVKFSKTAGFINFYICGYAHFVSCVFHFSFALNCFYKFDEETFLASGHKQRPLPIKAWTPLPSEFVNNHYWFAYATNMYGGQAGGLFCLCSQALTIILPVFGRGQFHILHHFLENLPQYSKKVAYEFNLSKDEADRRCIRFCIKYHNSIIKYVRNINKTMNLLTLIGFLVFSVQSAIIISDMITEFDYVGLFSFVYLILNFNHIFLFYWNANELKINGTDVATAIFRSEWCDYSTANQLLIKLIILRSQKPVVLTGGPFFIISNELILKIINATYSYTMLLTSRGN